MTVGGRGRLGGGGMERKGKRTHGQGQQCGDCCELGIIRGINGNGKNAIKNKIKPQSCQEGAAYNQR